MRTFTVTVQCNQIVSDKDLCAEDRADAPSHGEYQFEVDAPGRRDAREAALDEFHYSYAIAELDCFEIYAKKVVRYYPREVAA